MSDLSNIMDDSVYLARDYSSIIRWFISKLSHITTEWTDTSVTEPDTLSLSYIAHVYDLINYLIDNKYIDTILSKTESVKFLSYLYKIIGSELEDYDSVTIKVMMTNKSDNPIEVNQLDILRMRDHQNELFTCMGNYIVQPRSSQELELLRGTPVYASYRKEDIVNGYIVIPVSNINRNLVLVTVDGVTNLERCDDALFTEDPKFSVHQYGDYETSVRLSPSAYRNMIDDAVITYIVNDPYQLAENSSLILLKNISELYDITSLTTDATKSVSINDMKNNYYRELSTVNTMMKTTFDTSKFMIGRIDYLKFRYLTDPIFRYASIDYETGELSLQVFRLPENPIEITYIVEKGADLLAQEFTTTVSSTEQTISITLPDGYTIKKESMMMIIDTDVSIDLNGYFISINSKPTIIFDYSTSDNNPISNFINNGTFNYDNNYLILNFNYIPSDSVIIYYTYKYNNEVIQDKLVITITSLRTALVISIPDNATMMKNSIIVECGDNIANEVDGVITTTQSDEDIFLESVISQVLINNDESDIRINQLMIKPINVSAIVYLYKSGTDINTIKEDVINALNTAYAKGVHPPGEVIKKLNIMTTIENSNPNIRYTVLNNPEYDTPVDTNQLPVIGSIDLVFERGE